jgi:hypothetical protein
MKRPAISKKTVKKDKIKSLSDGEKPSLRKFDPTTLCSAGFMLLIVLAVTAMRIHTLEVPLERDEGEFAYFGQLILQGIPPYQEAYSMKLPGVHLAYAAIMALFGQTPSGIHLGLIVVNLIAIVFVYLLAREFFGVLCASTAAASYALLSINTSVLGLFAHATHFVLVCALPGIWLLRRGMRLGRTWMYPVSGFLLGCSILMKQPGAFLVMFGWLYILWEETRRKPFSWKSLAGRLGLFSAGAVLPYFLTCVILWFAGVFDKFWFWTATYASAYGSRLTLHEGMRLLISAAGSIYGENPYLWMLFLAGVILLFMTPKGREAWIFTTGFLIFSFLAVCPGLYFREHYFILLLPAAALLIGIAVETIADFVKNIGGRNVYGGLAGLILLVIAFYNGVAHQGYFLVNVRHDYLSRMTYGTNPFVESLKVAEYIKKNSAKGDRMAILGSEPQIYFYANRKSASGHIYAYGLMEPHKYALKMQEEMAEQIEKTAPKYILCVNVFTSWLINSQSEKYILLWADHYLSQNYELVMYVGINLEGDPDKTQYYFHETANAFAAENRGRPETLMLYKRKDGYSQ